MTIFAGYTAARRRSLFFGVCLPVRMGLSIAVVALYYSEPAAMAAVGLAVALVAAAYNKRQAAYDPAWWKRWPHMLVAVAIAIVSAVALASSALDNNLYVWVAVLLAADWAWALYAGMSNFCTTGPT
jgi:hypothetical protein